VGKLFTPLCPYAVLFGTSQLTVALSGWAGNRGSGIALPARRYNYTHLRATFIVTFYTHKTKEWLNAFPVAEASVESLKETQH